MTLPSFKKYATVILDVAVEKMLDYGLTDDQALIARRGMRVVVPLRGHLKMGYIFSLSDQPNYPKVQGISRFVAEAEVMTEDLFDLCLWMKKFYCCSLREIFQIMLPAIVRKDKEHKVQLFIMRAKTKEEIKEYCEKIRNKSSAQANVLDVMLQVTKGMLLTELMAETKGSKSPIDTLIKKGFLTSDIVRVDRSPLINADYFKTKHKTLNTEQQSAYNVISKAIDESRFETHLLYGITGSGKTEVYLQAIDKVLKKNQCAIMLVPEISLTEQTIERFRSRFEDNIAVLHHRLSQGERFDEWHRIRRKEAQIIIGARSAVFSPVKDLGLIIVDEEHEQSYKQSESTPSYHARDLAVMRGKMANCPVILGSATPSLESYYNASIGKYTLSRLNQRAEAATLPSFKIVDMKKEYERNKGYTNFSDDLLNAIKKRKELGEQSILFLNRRGYHTTLLCNACSHTIKCTHCDVSLTFHMGQNTLSCHLCGLCITPPPKICPACKSDATMKYKGVGTELIEKSLLAIFPDLKVLRIDADTTRHKGSHQKLLRDFGSGKADVLIGTQMIAKGLHFPEVTLVGVLNSDNSLNIPDFRASEMTFQLITQVAGRAGRGAMKGEVIVQTLLPENSTILLAAEQNYESFYKDEIEIRKLFEYPPFSSLTKLTFSGKEENGVRNFAENYRRHLMKLLPEKYQLLPVIPSGHAKIKDNFRFQLIIRGPSIYPISQAIAYLKEQNISSKSVHVLIDINPTSTFF